MWRVVKVCPNCMCGEFEKDEEYGTYICIDCEKEWEEYDLDTIEFQE